MTVLHSGGFHERHHHDHMASSIRDLDAPVILSLHTCNSGSEEMPCIFDGMLACGSVVEQLLAFKIVAGTLAVREAEEVPRRRGLRLLQ